MIVFLSVILWQKTLCVVQHLIDDSLPVLQPYLPWSVRIRESHEQSLPMIHFGIRPSGWQSMVRDAGIAAETVSRDHKPRSP